ncbi:hypothetical protein [Flaviaesturariibacter terrae]
MKRISFLVLLSLCLLRSAAQGAHGASLADSLAEPAPAAGNPQLRSYAATASLLDAALTSLNSMQSLVSKDNYRNRVQALNNPASSELGYSLEGEIQAALQPILSKARSVAPSKFSQVVSSLLQAPKPATGSLSLLPTLSALVSNLAIQEKRVTREDVDSFLRRSARYFAPYEQLHAANERFEQQVARLNGRLTELQFDIREYTLDIVTLLHPREPRGALRQRPLEELLLQYLDGPVLDTTAVPYPSDGVKGAKDICNNVEKLFREYQKIYGDNYNDIRGIVQSARALGRSGAPSADATLRELETLYNESAQADVLNLRLRTLAGRLQALVLTTQAAR